MIFFFLKGTIPDGLHFYQRHIWSKTLIPVGSALNHLQGWSKHWSHRDQWNVLAKMADIVLPAMRRRRQRRHQRLPPLFSINQIISFPL